MVVVGFDSPPSTTADGLRRREHHMTTKATAYAMDREDYDVAPEPTAAQVRYATASHARDHALVKLVELITNYEPDGCYMGEDGEADAEIDQVISRLNAALYNCRIAGAKIRR